MAFPTVDNVYTGGEVSGCTDMTYLKPYLYVLYYGNSPAYRPKVHKLNPETYEKVAEWLAPVAAHGGKCICSDGKYLYVGTSNAGSLRRPIRVYKINPEMMTTVSSWAGASYSNGQAWSESLKFDSVTERLLVLEDGTRNNVGSSSFYRIYKLKQDLTEDMHKDAGEGPHSQYYGNAITIMGNNCYIATGDNPGAIDKRQISDLALLDYFEGNTSPDEYIEGIFFNVCNDGEYIYTATYDYDEYRPTRLIKVNPSDMTRAGTYYGAVDELMAYGSLAYGGKVYMLLIGLDGGSNTGEQVLQIDPTTMTRTARYQNWAVDYNSCYAGAGAGDGLRLHIGFWDVPSRSVLQFAEVSAPPCGIVSVGDKVLLLPIENLSGNLIALKSGNATLTDKALIAPLNNQAALKLDFRNCNAKVNDKIVCFPIERKKENIVAMR